MRITKAQIVDLRGETLKESVEIEGEAASGTVLCNGKVQGEVRVRIGRSYQDLVEKWNRTGDWTRAVQEAAPSGVKLRDLVIEGKADTHQLYCGPGVTELSCTKTEFTGTSKGPSVYLSMESARNRIRYCKFRASTGVLQARREVMAIDGSAENLIEGCDFLNCRWGGIYVYRNSGENGTIRHQAPMFNRIEGCRFDLSGMWLIRPSIDVEVPHGIILGSRQGKRERHNDLDEGWPWGSSKDDRDFARQNTVAGCFFKGDWWKRWVLDTDKGNTVLDSRTW